MPGYDNELAQIVAELNRAASGSHATQHAIPQASGSLDQLLSYASRQNASDLLLIAGAPVALRIDGKLTPAATPALNAEDTRNLLLPLLAAKEYQELQWNKSIDFFFSARLIGRFRADLRHSRGALAANHR